MPNVRTDTKSYGPGPEEFVAGLSATPRPALDGERAVTSRGDCVHGWGKAPVSLPGAAGGYCRAAGSRG